MLKASKLFFAVLVEIAGVALVIDLVREQVAFLLDKVDAEDVVTLRHRSFVQLLVRCGVLCSSAAFGKKSVADFLALAQEVQSIARVLAILFLVLHDEVDELLEFV